MRVFIQGELGSFSHQAAKRLVRGASVVCCPTFAAVFEGVARGGAGVVPVENTVAGPIREVARLLREREVFVRAELRLRIAHCLIAPTGVKFAGVRRVLSHPVALDQCRKFFSANPQLRAVSFYDTAGAVRHIVKKKKDTAAIAGAAAAREYGARILRRNLEDTPRNFTRFLLITSSEGT